MKDLKLLIGVWNHPEENDCYHCSLIDVNKAKMILNGVGALEMAKREPERVEVKFMNGTKEKVGSLTSDGIFEVEFDCGWKSTEKINLNELNFDKCTINESGSNSKKYLVILNFDSDIGILFKKNFDKKNALHLKKIEKGNLDDVLDKAYMVAQEDVENEVNYQIVVEQEGIPVCFELGIITPDMDLVPRYSEEEETINESIETDKKFDWFLEYRNKDDIILYGDERDDFIDTDRYPKHKEFEGNAALNKVRKMLRDGIDTGISVTKGGGNRKIEGFVRLSEDGKTLMIEIESNGSKNGSLIPLI